MTRPRTAEWTVERSMEALSSPVLTLFSASEVSRIDVSQSCSSQKRTHTCMSRHADEMVWQCECESKQRQAVCVKEANTEINSSVSNIAAQT